MTPDDAKLILGAYRPGTEDAEDPFFAEALRLAATDAELAQWLAREQAFDAAVSARLTEGSAPAGLKRSVLAVARPVRVMWTFSRAAALAAAAAVVAALVTFALVRPGAPRGDALADFRAEMVSFVALTPPLELQTPEVPKILSHLSAAGTAEQVRIPEPTAELKALGCRTLHYRGHPVALICFQRKDGKLVHLLVVPRSAFGDEAIPAQRTFAQQGEWATAVWREGERVYLLTTPGAPAQLGTLL